MIMRSLGPLSIASSIVRGRPAAPFATAASTATTARVQILASSGPGSAVFSLPPRRGLFNWVFKHLSAEQAAETPACFEYTDATPRVIGWGKGDNGQLGFVCDSEAPPTELEILRNNRPHQISCGASHVISLLPHPLPERAAKETILCGWGSNFFMQLGTVFDLSTTPSPKDMLSEPDDQYEPRPLVGAPGEKVRKVVCGYYHNLMLTESGKVFVWGTAPLGTEDEEPIPTPRLVEAFSGKRVKDIACAGYASMVIVEGGKGDLVFVWGYVYTEKGLVRCRSPRLVRGLPHGSTAVACGAGAWHFALAVQTPGATSESIVVLGRSGLSDMGAKYVEDTQRSYEENVPPEGPLCDETVPVSKGIRLDIELHPVHILHTKSTTGAIIKPSVEQIVGGYGDGTVQTFGRNDLGQLGRPTAEHHGRTSEPVVDWKLVVDSSASKAERESANGSLSSSSSSPTSPKQTLSSSASSLTASSWPSQTWKSASEENGASSAKPIATSNPLSFVTRSIDNDPIIHIASGRAHMMALTQSGLVFGWGENENGQVKHASGLERGATVVTVPTQVFKKPDLSIVTCGSEFTIVA